MAHEASIVSPRTGRYDRRGVASMAAVHLVALAALWLYPPTWELIAVCVGSYYLRMFAITAGYHRYFAHRAYRTSRAFQLVLALLGGASTQRSALWWAAHHRDHHRHSDQAGDVHSPVRDGLLWAHIGWVVHASSTPLVRANMRDFDKFPELHYLHRHELVPVVAYAAALAVLGGAPWLFWGYFVSTVLLWHGTFVINSLAHVWGSRRYATTDDSRNNLWLALLTLGEGWHNNHHHYQSSARQGFFWWEIDVSYYVLRALAAVGIVWQLKPVPERMLRPTAAAPVARERAQSATAVPAPVPAPVSAPATPRSPSAKTGSPLPAPSRNAADSRDPAPASRAAA